MPTYTYECQTCLRHTTGVRRIADRHNSPVCDCGDKTELRITPTAFSCPAADFDGYRCVATGQEITSEAQRKRVMRENDLVDAREFPEPDFEQLEHDQAVFRKEAEKPIEVSAELQDAMKREGHGALLES